MLLSIEAWLDYAFPRPADVLLQIEAAALPDQRLLAQSLVIGSDNPIRAVPGEEGIGQRTWARAERRLTAHYTAEVQVSRAVADLAGLGATASRDLPGHVVSYLLPSRYCESDRFEHFVAAEFAGLEGGRLAAALVDWVAGALTYDGHGSPLGTSALHTFAERRGVCRDYAHLLVALARAAEIPARCVSAYAPGVDPPDFHAVAELWLEGAWHLVDPTEMGSSADLARVCVGRDATDIAFMTVFGTADLVQQRVCVRAIA
ncbi:transglutaminase family protein [Sphingomonas sp.]|uniref:transglutaminase-like domain-containing protein n=1 Tax=Sphingomonas sp. TaxID=28214 RepID=UPI0035C7FBB3